MKNILKWVFILGSGFIVVIIAAALIVPKFIDVKKYKPVIEEKVTQATGRSFTMGDDMDVSIFPWVGIKLTDIHLGNSEGSATKQMVSVKNFEVRLKVMPLLSKKIEVKTFVLDSPMIYLERQKDGTANWEGIGKSPPKTSKADKKAQPSSSGQGLPIDSLKVDKFLIVNGQFIYKDQITGQQKQISDFNLELADISLDKPISILFNAMVDGKPVSLKGTAGPIGQEPGKGTMSIDLALKALDALDTKVKGTVIDPVFNPQFDVNIAVSSFSPRKLMAALGQPFPVQTSDPKVLDKISLTAQIKGTPKNFSVSRGQLVIDDSKLDFSATAKDFTRPDLTFDLALDNIDLDRYLPEPSKSDSSPKDGYAQPATPTTTAPVKKNTDYGPLRKLVMDGKITAGKIKAHGAVTEKINIHITAKDGIITIDPFGMNLYQGSIASTLGLDVRNQEPKISLILKATGIQAGPLIKDAMQKEIIEGTLASDINFTMQGEDPDMIKKTLNGKGSLLFTDGAIIGIDIAGMMRNVKAKFGGEKPAGEKPRTDFAELNIPFTAKNGLIKTDGTRMMSPLIRIIAAGDIDLVKELLDMRVDPKFVATLKGQGDTKERSGLMVPLLITGSFASPKIRPDLKGMLGDGAKGLNIDSLKQQVLETTGDEKSKKEMPVKDIEKQIKNLLPGFGK
ncbi:MAG: AsmA family protein [Pseudomonadota bacterium]